MREGQFDSQSEGKRKFEIAVEPERKFIPPAGILFLRMAGEIYAAAVKPSMQERLAATRIAVQSANLVLSYDYSSRLNRASLQTAVHTLAKVNFPLARTAVGILWAVAIENKVARPH